MSTQNIDYAASSSVYDDQGRTRIPDGIREKLGDLQKGDKITYLVKDDGEIVIKRS